VDEVWVGGVDAVVLSIGGRQADWVSRSRGSSGIGDGDGLGEAGSSSADISVSPGSGDDSVASSSSIGDGGAEGDCTDGGGANGGSGDGGDGWDGSSALEGDRSSGKAAQNWGSRVDIAARASEFSTNASLSSRGSVVVTAREAENRESGSGRRPREGSSSRVGSRLGRERRTSGERAGNNVDGVSIVLIIALNSEGDALSNEGRERSSISGGRRSDPDWGIVLGNNVGELHQEIDHDSALSTIGDNDGSGVETIKKGSVVPAVETSGANTGSRRVARSVPIRLDGERVSENITIGISGSNLEAIGRCSGNGSNGKNVRDWRIVVNG
jgi:hypothetical protein